MKKIIIWFNHKLLLLGGWVVGLKFMVGIGLKFNEGQKYLKIKIFFCPSVQKMHFKGDLFFIFLPYSKKKVNLKGVLCRVSRVKKNQTSSFFKTFFHLDFFFLIFRKFVFFLPFCPSEIPLRIALNY